jgi:hypothetical protein
MDALCSSKILVTMCQTAWLYIRKTVFSSPWEPHTPCYHAYGPFAFRFFSVRIFHPLRVCRTSTRGGSETQRFFSASSYFMLSGCRHWLVLLELGFPLSHMRNNLPNPDNFIYALKSKVQKWRWRQYIPPKRWYLSARLHGIMSKKTTNVVFTDAVV